jgi:sterol desaturase/sphingolipid hydroxylase (fatty acid hydroxylase superfamily)
VPPQCGTEYLHLPVQQQHLEILRRTPHFQIGCTNSSKIRGFASPRARNSPMFDVSNFTALSPLLDILFSPTACWTYAGLAVFLVAIVLVDLVTGRSIRRYWAATFRTDLIYMFLLVGGVYGLVQQPLLAWVDGFLRQHASYLYLDLLNGLPASIQIPTFLVAVDFSRYWKHRCMHSLPCLWAFHCIHHAPDELNFLTNYRMHLIEFIVDGLVTLVPVVLLGVPPSIWLPVNLLLLWYTGLHHSDLNLRFGWLERVLVSPQFHRLHHSTDRRDFDSNFGAALSLWDWLFGTARSDDRRPASYGVADAQIPTSILGQTIFPAWYIIGRTPLGRRRR